MAKREGRRAAGGERRQWLASSLLVALAPLLAFPRGTSSERIVNGTWSLHPSSPFRAGRLQRESSTVRGALYYMLGFGRDDEEKII